MPFGPFLAAGAVIAVFVGPQIADAYLNLFDLSHRPQPARTTLASARPEDRMPT